MSSQLNDALAMFIHLGVELSVLFIGISLLVGVLQRHIPPSRVQSLLSSSRRSSYLLAAGLGAMTPFCSCSTIPMLKGLVRARAGFGPMMVFLFASPLLNPIVVALLLATFGMTLTVIYVLAAFLVALGAGWLLQTLRFERFIRHQATEADSGCGSNTICGGATSSNCDSALATPKGEQTSCGSGQPTSRAYEANTNMNQQTAACCSAEPKTVGRYSRYSGLWSEAWSDFVEVLPYLLIGIAIGSVIYGFVPTGVLSLYAGPNNPLAIPVAAVIGVPLYIRAEAVIPLAAALMAKGVGAGTVMALIIGSAGASLTELILLRSLFQIKLIAAFVSIVFAMAITAGYITFFFF